LDQHPLEGARILIVEDEYLLAAMLEDDLRAAGCTIVGPFSGLAQAMEASRREAFDVALLDINLNGQMVYPLADELSSRGVPAVFLTGYGALNLPERFRLHPRVSKPYDVSELVKTIRKNVPAPR